MSFAGRARSMALSVLAATACGGESPAPAPERIVLVVVDTLRADFVSPYSPKARTPHIQSLADRGQVFERAYGSYHQTTMSMAALFTGRVPSLETGPMDQSLEWTGKTWCGMRRFATPPLDEACVPKELPALAGSLREAGYWTVGVVTNTLLFQPLGFERGFDEWIEVGWLDASRTEPGYQANLPAARSAENANSMVAKILDQRPTDHFFLYVHYMEAHDYAATGSPYSVGVRRSDRAVGQLLAILRESDLLEGATVFLVSDHGERLSESHFTKGGPLHYGNPSFEEVLHVPLVVSPGLPGRDTKALLRSDDIHRLILETAGIEPEDPGDLEDGELFVSEQWFQTYRKGRFKSYRRRGEERISLVDLEADPRETQDVADRYPEVAKAHEHRMRELSEHLRTERKVPSSLSEEDARRLEALGYSKPTRPSPIAR